MTSNNRRLTNLCWHRSRTIFEFNSDYPYNTVKAFFWKCYNHQFKSWNRDESNFIKKIVHLETYEEMIFKNNIIIYRKQTAAEPTVIEVLKFQGRSVFQVILTGDPMQAEKELKQFFNVLHKAIDIYRAEKRLIYSEQFIRYHEDKEHDVRQAIAILYRLFGGRLIENRHKATNDVIYLSRATLFLKDSRIDIKTYRHKNYRSPAQSILDHPKLEATVYYEKSTLEKSELEQLARDIIATIVHYTDLYEYILPPNLNYQYAESGYGQVDNTILKSLTAENLKWFIEQFEKSNNALENKIRRRIAFEIAEGAKTAKEISQKLNIPLRTVQYHLRKLRMFGLIECNRLRNSCFYTIKIP